LPPPKNRYSGFWGGECFWILGWGVFLDFGWGCFWILGGDVFGFWGGVVCFIVTV